MRRQARPAQVTGVGRVLPIAALRGSSCVPLVHEAVPCQEPTFGSRRTVRAK
jgi:hypothetical protein